MQLDLADPEIRARTSLVAGSRLRLVLDYPRIPPYPDRVMAALSDLLRPAPERPPRPRGRPRKQTSPEPE